MNGGPKQKKTLAFRFVDSSLLVLRENAVTPRDEDWDAFLTVLEKNRDNFARLRILVRTEGGGPSAPQRKRLEKALGGRPVRVAVVTNSVAVRFIVSSIALLNREIRTFSVDELANAYQHLRLNPAERRDAEKAAFDMEDMVDLEQR